MTKSIVNDDKQISWLLHPLKFYRIRKEKERNRLAKEKEEAEVALNLARNKMLESSCAINNREKCYKDCTHFKDGFVFMRDNIDDTTSYSYKHPSCRLW
jgi:hypothetical protein